MAVRGTCDRDLAQLRLTMILNASAVVLLGPPGVGKGTQGVLLEEITGWTRIATGDLLRQARSAGTELGARAQSFMDAGQLVPDEVIIGLVREVVSGLDADVGMIFDGFPRTIPQAQALTGVLSSCGRRLGGVLVLEAPDDVLVRRISGRRVHPGSGRVYHVDFNPPQTDGLDDLTGDPLIHREDDRPDTVQRRLDIYREQTEPLVAWYRESGQTVDSVDADRSVQDIQTSLRTILGVEDSASGEGS